MRPNRLGQRVLARAALVALVIALPAFGGDPVDEAAALGAKAEYILDHWDGDAGQLETAKNDIDEAVRLDPSSAHLRGIQARQILLAGTTEEGIRPSALRDAQGLLMRAALEMQPPDARVFATLAHVMTLRDDTRRRRWALVEARRLGPHDAWVDLGWYETSQDLRYLEQALDDGLASPVELRKALDILLDQYVRTRQAAKATGAYERRIALDPDDPLVRGHYAREMIVWMTDFSTGERAARDALAIRDYPHARQSLSLALYGQWAQAARDHEGPDKVQALYRKAHDFDPGGHLIPTCLADWKPLEFVYASLEQKNVRREQMHQC